MSATPSQPKNGMRSETDAPRRVPGSSPQQQIDLGQQMPDRDSIGALGEARWRLCVVFIHDRASRKLAKS